MAVCIGTKPSTRQKHAKTARGWGRAIADSPDMIKRQSIRRWWVASVTDPGLWYGVILGAMGMVCACPDQQGRGGICKHLRVGDEEQAVNAVRNGTLDIHYWPVQGQAAQARTIWWRTRQASGYLRCPLAAPK